MLKHPVFGRVGHGLFTAIPDIAFLLLAVAGLTYLFPGEWMQSLENRRGVRTALRFGFFIVGGAAIVVNAVNREDQEHKETISGDRMNTVMASVVDIQKALVSNKIMTEATRREHLTASLRDQYILTHNPIDPEILAGTKMPPNDWMSKRLAELGEKWTVTPSSDRTTPPQIIQQVSNPPEQKAQIRFSFYTPTVSGDNIVTNKFIAPEDGRFKLRISAVVVGDVPAENVTIWLRVCGQCAWANLPQGFAPLPAKEESFDRVIALPEMLPNVLVGPWDVEISMQAFPPPTTTVLAGYYACKNWL